MKRVLEWTTAAALVAASAAAFPAPDVTEPEDTLPAVRGPLPSAERDLGGDVDRRLAALDREEQASKHELDRLAQDVGVAHARTVARGRAYVRLARAGLLPVVGGFDALLAHAARLERIRSALSHDVSLEREQSHRRIALGRRLAELAAQRGPLEAEQQALARARAAVLSEQDRTAAFERAFSGERSLSHTAVYGATGPGDPAEVLDGFAGLKGKLPFPITGRSEIRSARLPQSDGPGLLMWAARGTPVRSVCAGRVAFADAYADYGSTVILDHGDGYYTVSANLGAIEVRVGDAVPSGSRIGTVGDAGTRARLFFEVRFRTRTLDPAEWFGI
jgi:murein hydrolase activator